MIAASELFEGMVLRIEGQIYKVIEVEAKAGAAKMGGVVKTKLINVRTGHAWSPHFRPHERLEELELDRRLMEFLYFEEENCIFMRSDTFEQVAVPKSVLGPEEKFLEPGMQLHVDFFEGEPLRVAFPDVIEVRVAETAPPEHAQQDTAWKDAKLENGLNLQIPMFVGPGEVVRVDVKTGHYLERVRGERKRGA
ncbi:MAG TPA: hypothetical protein VLX32_09775 [Candidatus Acidoferrum sp.]|nr:hypothetical protein [Candidatus Acidoferrum sp.]